MKGIKINDGLVGYRDLPKVACTSIKREFFRLEKGKVFEPSLRPNGSATTVHQYFGYQGEDISNCKNKMIVIRDPIKRFLSAYGNRVTEHKELSKSYIENDNPALAKKIPVFNPGLGQFIEFLSLYRQVESINWHTNGINTFVDNIKDFTHIYKLENLAKMERDLSKILDKKCKFSVTQTGGIKFSIKDLLLIIFLNGSAS